MPDMAVNGNGNRPKQSGIHVVIVGAGFAGLTAAIECVRHGHTAQVLESYKSTNAQLGDIISFGSNSGRIFQRWSGVPEKLEPICHHGEKLEYRYGHDGSHIYTQWWGTEQENYGKRYNGHRGEIHKIIFDHAIELGVDIKLGQQVTEYFETDEHAGVMSNGQRITGDVVLGADGVRSKARTLVLGYDDKPKASGYAIYRAWMDAAPLAENDLTKDLVNGDTHTGWLGPDIHFLAASIKGGKEFSWVFTHKDERNVDEGWSEPGDHEDACRILEGWAPAVHTIVRLTPPDKLVDWKLVYRDPLPTWVSPKKRIALIGDAAHPFLPTSIQGASQAMEDGATIAVCLELAGKEYITDALPAYEKIRYERVKAVQKTGETTRDKWHKADFTKLKENPEAIKLVREAWVLNHDAQEHAYRVYDQAVKSPDRQPSRPAPSNAEPGDAVML